MKLCGGRRECVYLSWAGKHHLLTYVDSQEKEHKVMIDHLQSVGMPMASLHKHVTFTKDHASPITGHRKWQSSLTNYVMYFRVVAGGTLS